MIHALPDGPNDLHLDHTSGTGEDEYVPYRSEVWGRQVAGTHTTLQHSKGCLVAIDHSACAGDGDERGELANPRLCGLPRVTEGAVEGSPQNHAC